MTEKDRPYTQKDLDDVLDHPEWTAEDIAEAKRIEDIDPELAANIRRDLRKPIRPPQIAPMHAPTREPARS